MINVNSTSGLPIPVTHGMRLMAVGSAIVNAGKAIGKILEESHRRDWESVVYNYYFMEHRDDCR